MNVSACCDFARLLQRANVSHHLSLLYFFHVELSKSSRGTTTLIVSHLPQYEPVQVRPCLIWRDNIDHMQISLQCNCTSCYCLLHKIETCMWSIGCFIYKCLVSTRAYIFNKQMYIINTIVNLWLYRTSGDKSTKENTQVSQ